MSEWFGTWFDSEYYHLLYKDRDYTEAEAFVERLVDYLEPNKSATIHDLACGKGRHSIHLNKLGFTVDGSDYSANSILKLTNLRMTRSTSSNMTCEKPYPKSMTISLISLRVSGILKRMKSTSKHSEMCTKH